MVSGCSVPMMRQSANIVEGSMTSTHRDLISLPAPKGKLVGAVYKFTDQTGQRKNQPASGTATFSTAVTQGGASMLAHVLDRSGWFIILERENMNDILEERKIIRSTRLEHGNKDVQGNKLPPLPPLLFAGVIFEGGIVSYDSNTVTGGFGARWFGIGPLTRWQRDQVTVYVRAVSVNNGRVLQSIAVTKTVLSRELGAGVYKFVTPRRLLELETGTTSNEPVTFAVMEAMEKATMGVIIQGVIDGNWELENPEDINHPVIQQYLADREDQGIRVNWKNGNNGNSRNLMNGNGFANSDLAPQDLAGNQAPSE
jgi:curli production assembly/transport component CsgG